jgi:hypothetical protein
MCQLLGYIQIKFVIFRTFRMSDTRFGFLMSCSSRRGHQAALPALCGDWLPRVSRRMYKETNTAWEGRFLVTSTACNEGLKELHHGKDNISVQSLKYVSTGNTTQSVQWLGYGLYDRSSFPSKGYNIFFVATLSRPALEWVPAVHCVWGKAAE